MFKTLICKLWDHVITIFNCLSTEPHSNNAISSLNRTILGYQITYLYINTLSLWKNLFRRLVTPVSYSRKFKFITKAYEKRQILLYQKTSKTENFNKWTPSSWNCCNPKLCMEGLRTSIYQHTFFFFFLFFHTKASIVT